MLKTLRTPIVCEEESEQVEQILDEGGDALLDESGDPLLPE
jgi:hypothetical protein